MNYPSMIKGVWTSYSDSGSDAEVPIEDIYSFVLRHDSYRNGLQLIANIKSELITKYSCDYSKIEIKGKYRFSQKSFTIRNKDMPKFRRELYKEIMKIPNTVKRVGINAGTPIARSAEYKYKELIVGKEVA